MSSQHGFTLLELMVISNVKK
ncbi:prepilin-type N-terminal cleavage/methylation domain-containing protein [Edwardsiella tarda]